MFSQSHPHVHGTTQDAYVNEYSGYKLIVRGASLAIAPVHPVLQL